MDNYPPQHFNHEKENQIVNKKKVKVSKIKIKSVSPKPIKISNKCCCKKLDEKTHSSCSKSCGCFKNGLKCSIKCRCKGICSNGKSISDHLFFKVWRNKIIRNEITGYEKLEIINEKVQFKKELIKKLEHYKIKYNDNDINHYTKLYGGSLNLDLTKENFIMEEYFKYERENRLNQFKNQFVLYNGGIFVYSTETGIDKHNDVLLLNIFRGENSNIITRYINAISPEDQLKLPPINELIVEELKEIETIIETIKSLFQNDEGLEFYINSSHIQLFIRGDIKMDTLIYREKDQQTHLKKEKVIGTLLEMGIDSHHCCAEINNYSRFFKKNDIISYNVWSFDKIINTEKEFKYIEIEKQKRKDFILNSLNENKIIYRPNSEIINKYINNIPPNIKEANDTIPNSTLLTIRSNSSSILLSPTIEQVIESEKKFIELFKNKVIDTFKIQGLKFNEESNLFINFIKQIRDYGSNFDLLLKSFIEFEIEYEKEEKKQEIINKFKSFGITDSVFEKDKQNYINTFKPMEIIENKVISLEQLVLNELKAKDIYQIIVCKLKEMKIEVRPFFLKSSLVLKYLKMYRENDTVGSIFDGNDNATTIEDIIKFEIDYKKRTDMLRSNINYLFCKPQTINSNVI